MKNPCNMNIEDINFKINSDYEIKKAIFFKEEFTYNHFNMINRLICDSNNLTNEIKKNNRLHIILFKLIKDLLFTELEIVYLALFLENFGWENPTNIKKESENPDNDNDFDYDNEIKYNYLTFEDNLFFIALFIKVYLVK